MTNPAQWRFRSAVENTSGCGAETPIGRNRAGNSLQHLQWRPTIEHFGAPTWASSYPSHRGSVLAGFRGEERLRRFLVVADAATWADAADVLGTRCRKSIFLATAQARVGHTGASSRVAHRPFRPGARW
jgi:hypothetical protein